MIVYVLIGGWSWEGYEEPVGVYSTKELAVAAKANPNKKYDYSEIYEYEMDRGRIT